jgi:hypothetical protein
MSALVTFTFELLGSSELLSNINQGCVVVLLRL